MSLPKMNYLRSEQSLLDLSTTGYEALPQSICSWSGNVCPTVADNFNFVQVGMLFVMMYQLRFGMTVSNYDVCQICKEIINIV